jgi:hypothetical protein
MEHTVRNDNARAILRLGYSSNSVVVRLPSLPPSSRYGEQRCWLGCNQQSAVTAVTAPPHLVCRLAKYSSDSSVGRGRGREQERERGRGGEIPGLWCKSSGFLITSFLFTSCHRWTEGAWVQQGFLLIGLAGLLTVFAAPVPSCLTKGKINPKIASTLIIMSANGATTWSPSSVSTVILYSRLLLILPVWCVAGFFVMQLRKSPGIERRYQIHAQRNVSKSCWPRFSARERQRVIGGGQQKNRRILGGAVVSKAG